MKTLLMLGILLGSLMCSSGVDSLPIGTEDKVEKYLYENGRVSQSGETCGLIGGVQFAVVVVENNAIKELLDGSAYELVITNKAGFTNFVNHALASTIATNIAPRGAGEYAIWMYGYDGGESLMTAVTGFKRFFVTGTPGNISYDGASVTNMVPQRSRKMPIAYPNAKRMVIRGQGFTYDSDLDSSLLITFDYVAKTYTYVFIPPEVTTNTVGVVEVTLNNDTVERYFLENGQKVPSVPNLAILTVPEAGPKLEVVGPPGTYIVQCSTNLVDWHPMQTVVVTYAKASAMDGTTNKQKFYRVRVAP